MSIFPSIHDNTNNNESNNQYIATQKNIIDGNIVTIYQNGKEYKFEFLDEKTVRRLSSIGGMEASGPMIIDSPMPSKIIKINFNKGDKVNEGDIIMIIEAMKMENEMKAPYNGTITDIFTSVNDTVESGAKLFSIE